MLLRLRRDGTHQQLLLLRQSVEPDFPFVRAVAATIIVSTGARLQVDQEKIDLGRRVFSQPVRAVFNLNNAGADVLKLSVPRVVTALEGC